MLDISKEDLKRVHNIQVVMLKELKRICDKHNIKYSIIGGTLLGAVRHKGFIPWDDDIDVAMLREEYERFRIACEKELDKKQYYFQDDRNDKEYRWGYGKIRKKGTLFLKENQEHLNFGQEIFIDIFPLDFVPERVIPRYLHVLYCFIIRKILWSEAGKKVENNKFKKLTYVLLSKIKKEQIYSIYYKYIFTRKATNLVRINLYPTKKPYGFPIDYFIELQEYIFEGESFFGIKQYDQYLRFKYGEYMVIPPIEEQHGSNPISKLIT